MSDKNVDVTDITYGVVTVENTKGLYRVVYYSRELRNEGEKQQQYRCEEFLSAEEAIQSAEIFNGLQLYCNDRDFNAIEEWAEVVSYSETEERWEKARRQDEEDEVVRRAVTQHREELCEEARTVERSLKEQISKLDRRNKKLARKLSRAKARHKRKNTVVA